MTVSKAPNPIVQPDTGAVRVSDIMAGAQKTWGPTLKKEELNGAVFFIHNMRMGEVDDAERGKVTILVAEIAIDADGIEGRNVITFGMSDERLPLLNYFQDAQERGEKAPPVGPCRLFEVNLKGGRTFWRIEDSDDGF